MFGMLREELGGPWRSLGRRSVDIITSLRSVLCMPEIGQINRSTDEIHPFCDSTPHRLINHESRHPRFILIRANSYQVILIEMMTKRRLSSDWRV